MIKLLLDMGLPRRAASDLRVQGWDVSHAGEIGMAKAADPIILDRAAQEGRVVVTLDSDFARIVAVGGLTVLGCVASVTKGGVRVRRLPVR